MLKLTKHISGLVGGQPILARSSAGGQGNVEIGVSAVSARIQRHPLGGGSRQHRLDGDRQPCCRHHYKQQNVLSAQTNGNTFAN